MSAPSLSLPTRLSRARSSIQKERLRLCSPSQQNLPSSWKGISSVEFWNGFKKRHLELSLRKPECLSRGRAEAFNQNRVDLFYAEAKSVIPDDSDKRHVWNCDETRLMNVAVISPAQQ
jgi:hypothetical protein